MATETTYNVIKVQELRAISSATGSDEIIINDVDSTPLETKKITVENFAYAIKDYVLPIASAEILGGIRVGEGLTINPATGVLRNDIYYINDLHDVQVVSPQPNQVLTYNGVAWVNTENASILEIIAGDGLSGGGSGGSIIINVNPGDGISIENDRVNVNTGLGLKTELDVLLVDNHNSLTFVGNRLAVNGGTAIVLDEFGVSVNYGRGLTMFGPTLEPDLGRGLLFNGNSIEPDLGLGLIFNRNSIEPNLGLGLQFINNQITVHYSEDAEETTPVPDNRVGGYVKNASLELAMEGEHKSETITPYTLKRVLDDSILDFKPTQPDSFQVDITEGYDVTVCIDKGRLSLTCVAEGYTEEGKPALGRFAYQWVETTSGSPVELQFTRRQVVTGTDTDTLIIDDYEAVPSTQVRKFRCNVTFTDLFSVDYEVPSEEVFVSLGNALEIKAEPNDLDLSVEETGTFTVEVGTIDPALDPITPTYQWTINDIPITGETNPANTGYSFSGFDTDTLTVTRTEETAVSYIIACHILGGACDDGGLNSRNTLLTGPGLVSRDIINTTPVPTTYGAVGTYIALAAPSGIYSVGQLVTYYTGGRSLANFPTFGTWRLMNNPGNMGFRIDGHGNTMGVALFVRVS